MQGPLLFLTVVVEDVLAGPGIPRCWWYGRDFVQGLCLCEVVVEIVVVHYGLLPLYYCQWMEQPQLIGLSTAIIVVVHAVVLPAILQS